jgi:hypothetical protein
LDTLALDRAEENEAVELIYDLEIRGRLPRGTHEELRQRFGDFFVHHDAYRTVLSNLTVVDQAALRALLDMLWDVGGELHLVRAIARPSREGKGASEVDH